MGKSSTVAEITALQGALQTIRNTLGDRAVSLTPDQRKTLVKMGDNTRAFCQQAVAGLQANLGNMLPDLEVFGLVLDYTGYAALEPIVAEFEAVGELLDDTLKALSSDVMTSSIIGVTFLKTLN